MWLFVFFKFTLQAMEGSIEKECFKAVSHVVFDVDGLLLGLCSTLYAVHYNLFFTGNDF